MAHLVAEVPTSLFQPPVDETKSEALSYFLDACVRIRHHYHAQNEIDRAYSYIQFAYGKMQDMASQLGHDLEVRHWCLQRMDHLVVALMEFCNSQPQECWQAESKSLVEAHVSFMSAQHHLNLSELRVSA